MPISLTAGGADVASTSEEGDEDRIVLIIVIVAVLALVGMLALITFTCVRRRRAARRRKLQVNQRISPPLCECEVYDTIRYEMLF